jgi:hypothetical protein
MMLRPQKVPRAPALSASSFHILPGIAGRRFPRLLAEGITVFACLSGWACRTDGQSRAGRGATGPGQPPRPAASQPFGPRQVDFAPGVRIDYRVPQVEAAGEVILREGPLELFAYSKAPVPKEHESVLLLQASPERIYQALGLIGLVPGQPVRYFPETQTMRMPSGAAVDVLVRYEAEGRSLESSACDWMIDVTRGQPMVRTHWLFTGSQRLKDGVFYADLEGTVVTVVDFDSAVLSLPDLHTSSNAELWLAANTPAIPAVGTRVTLILRPADLRTARP